MYLKLTIFVAIASISQISAVPKPTKTAESDSNREGKGVGFTFPAEPVYFPGDLENGAVGREKMQSWKSERPTMTTAEPSKQERQEQEELRIIQKSKG